MKTDLSSKLTWSNSLTFKSAIIAAIALLLLIPLGMIKSVISEREKTAKEVENNISDQFGKNQTLVGPILNIPVEKLTTDKDGKITCERSWLHIMPETLDLKATLEPEIRPATTAQAARSHFPPAGPMPARVAPQFAAAGPRPPQLQTRSSACLRCGRRFLPAAGRSGKS